MLPLTLFPSSPPPTSLHRCLSVALSTAWSVPLSAGCMVVISKPACKQCVWEGWRLNFDHQQRAGGVEVTTCYRCKNSEFNVDIWLNVRLFFLYQVVALSDVTRVTFYSLHLLISLLFRISTRHHLCCYVTKHSRLGSGCVHAFAISASAAQYDSQGRKEGPEESGYKLQPLQSHTYT